MVTMNSRLCFFVVEVLAVLLIHEVVFSKCDLKNKTQNHVIKSSINGTQRKERQIPIDPSRMYLPPRIDAIASNGFGGQQGVPNDFDGQNNGGIGRDVYTKGQTVADGNFGSQAKNTNNLDGIQTSGLYGMNSPNGPGESSLKQNPDYNDLVTGGNDFGQFSNKNTGYGGVSLATTSCGNSLGTTQTMNNDIALQAGSTDDYGQNELLSTAQNQGPTKNDYSDEVPENSRFGQNSESENQGVRGTTVQNTAGGYDYTAPSTPTNDNRNGNQKSFGVGDLNGNYDASENQPFSGDGDSYGNVASNSFGRKPTTSEDYDKNANGENTSGSPFNDGSDTDDSYSNQAFANSNGYSGGLNFNNQNNPDKDPSISSQVNNNVNNGNYGQNIGLSNNRDFQTSKYHQGGTMTGYGQSSNGLNGGALPSTQSYGQNVIREPNAADSYFSGSKDSNLPTGNSFGQTSPNNRGFEQNPSSSFGQKFSETNKNHPEDIFLRNSQGPNSIESNGGLSSTPSLNSYEQISSGVNGFNQKGSSNYNGEFSLNSESSLGESNNYGQSGSNSVRNEKNSFTNNEYDQGSSSSLLGQQNQLPLNNNYGQPTSQSLANEENHIQGQLNGLNDGYNQGKSSNDFGQSQSASPQIPSNIYGQAVPNIENYGSSNSVPSTRGVYNQGDLSNVLNGFKQNEQTVQGSPNSYSIRGSQSLPSIRGNYNQNNQNSLTNNGYSREGLQTPNNSKSYRENNAIPNFLNQRNLANIQIGAHNQGTSIPVKNNYAQINTPQKGNYGQNGLSKAVIGENFGQGSSSLSSGYEQEIKPCSSVNSGNIGQSGLKSSTGVGSLTDSNSGNRNQKKHSTIVPKEQYQNSNLPGQSNFEKQRNNNGDYSETGLNEFSYYTPDNQPTNNFGNNNCGKSNHNSNNKQTEAIFSSNTGY